MVKEGRPEGGPKTKTVLKPAVAHAGVGVLAGSAKVCELRDARALGRDPILRRAKLAFVEIAVARAAAQRFLGDRRLPQPAPRDDGDRREGQESAAVPHHRLDVA